MLAEEGITAPTIEALLDMRYRPELRKLAVLPLRSHRRRHRCATPRLPFHAAHAQRYGYAMHDETVEERSPLRSARRRPRRQSTICADQSRLGRHSRPCGRQAGLVRRHGAVATPCYDRALSPGSRFAGPAVIPSGWHHDGGRPGWSARVDGFEDVV
ncbi:MAG: hypothetical protein R2854_17335 [Caldilineaceae bacterium]